MACAVGSHHRDGMSCVRPCEFLLWLFTLFPDQPLTHNTKTKGHSRKPPTLDSQEYVPYKVPTLHGESDEAESIVAGFGSVVFLLTFHG